MIAALRRNPGLVAIVLMLCAVYFHVAIDFKNKWDLPQSYYSHGYLVVPIVAYLIYRKREELAEMSPEPLNAGLAVLLLGCFVRVIGAYASINVMSGMSLLLVLLGLSLYLLGRRITWKLLFPLLFLVAMVPAPTQFINKISFVMKISVAENAVNILRSFGHGIVQEGSTLKFWYQEGVDTLTVGDVCSGLRSLIALIAFGALFAYLTDLSLWKRLALFAASIPAAFVANLVRILTIVLVALYYGSETAVGTNYLQKIGLGGISGEWGTLHDITGIIVYIVAFIVLFTLEKLLALIPCPKRRDTESEQ